MAEEMTLKDDEIVNFWENTQNLIDEEYERRRKTEPDEEGLLLLSIVIKYCGNPNEEEYDE